MSSSCDQNTNLTTEDANQKEIDISLFDDIIHKDGIMFVDTPEVMWLNKPDWMSHYAYPKRMKNGEVVYHAYANGKYPDKTTLLGMKRRFLFGVFVNYSPLIEVGASWSI